MEELEASLALNFNVSGDPNSSLSTVHPRLSVYKNYARHDPERSQEKRRKEIMKTMKEKRSNVVERLRNLTSDGFGEDEVVGCHADLDFPPTVVAPPVHISGDLEKDKVVSGRNVAAAAKRLKDQLMLSEWMIDVPEDFEDDWYMLKCPVGKRCLVVASQGTTKVFRRNGHLLIEFQSNLCGGSRADLNRKHNAILDCVFSNMKQFYVLDMMVINNMQLYNVDTECRWFIMESKFREELHEATVQSNFNPYPFVLCDRTYSCRKEVLEQLMAVESEEYDLDGLLFYHKKADYLIGTTPFQLWLVACMLPDFLGVKVADSYIRKKPLWYKSKLQHVKRVENNKTRVYRTCDRLTSAMGAARIADASAGDNSNNNDNNNNNNNNNNDDDDNNNNNDNNDINMN
ncbi:hypothetical protein HELRODRAFT_186161 [Helobdella robusta]|uniref:Snurportin-1 n=1 Tax=Helobdella robusta TaxID=6412 RepID=T1FNR0_HELRO|nr:hypothetical protein HELRODRAFT_186161 [Helobdella robusta]ESN92097.1 hypothetical protein HELRODRAFT_186161 [Helobdella robusta]